MGLIYKATFSNGKSYIGQTTLTLEKRKNQHKQSSKKNNTAFYHAINKYGWEDIVWEIIEDNIEDTDILNQREMYWINFFNTYKGEGYNSTLGGEGTQGYKIFETKEEVDELLMMFQQTGSITELALYYNCGYNVIRSIVLGESRLEISGLIDSAFYEKYSKKGTNYSNEQIQTIIDLHLKGKTNLEIEQTTLIPIKYIQDVLSGRILSKKTGIPHITREERQKYNPVNSKLTKELVLDIILMYKDGYQLKEIGEKYNKSSNRIYEIVNGITWSEVTGIEYNKHLKISPSGEKIRKFTKEDILRIVDLYNSGKNKKEIADLMNTSPSYIQAILSGRKWNSITHIKNNN